MVAALTVDCRRYFIAVTFSAPKLFHAQNSHASHDRQSVVVFISASFGRRCDDTDRCKRRRQAARGLVPRRSCIRPGRPGMNGRSGPRGRAGYITYRRRHGQQADARRAILRTARFSFLPRIRKRHPSHAIKSSATGSNASSLSAMRCCSSSGGNGIVSDSTSSGLRLSFLPSRLPFPRTRKTVLTIPSSAPRPLCARMVRRI